jgi:hypothetical protein
MARLLTLDQADAIVAACKQEAAAVGQPMNIAVVDDGGNLVAFCAMDGTKLIGEDISQKKALTAVYFQMDTTDLAPLVQPGQPLYGIEATTWRSTRCLRRRSAAQDRRRPGCRRRRSQRRHRRQDHQVAEAGRAAFSG